MKVAEPMLHNFPILADDDARSSQPAGRVLMVSTALGVGGGAELGRVGFARERQRIEPPHIEEPDGKTQQAHPDKSHWVQHRPLEVQAMRLDLADETIL